MEEFWEILKQLGIPAQDQLFYELAFTHRSYLNESKVPIRSNERLEFLGDSVLSFITSSFLYKLRSEDEEGDLTNLRSYIVKTESIAKVSQELGLGRFLRLSKGEEMSGGRENVQILANTFEALLGAIYLDQGLEAARTFVHSTLLPLFEKEVQLGAPRDAKSQLQEIAQTMTKTAPRYRILDTSGPDHAKHFKVGVFLKDEMIGVGEGTNKQQAEEQAAEQGLTKLTQRSEVQQSTP